MPSRPVTVALLAGAVAAIVASMVVVVGHARQPAAQPVVAFMGDSYTAGSREDDGFASRYPALIAEDLHIEPAVSAEPGAGYVRAGVVGVPFADEVAAVPVHARVVVIYGSRNDPFDGSEAAAIGQAARELIAAVKERAPEAAVMVIGPSYVEHPVPVGGVQNAAAIRRACAAADVRYVDALDWLQDPDPGVVGSDGIHPTSLGHRELAKHIGPLVADALQER
jgi:lysophospholipase L1-like esterase